MEENFPQFPMFSKISRQNETELRKELNLTSLTDNLGVRTITFGVKGHALHKNKNHCTFLCKVKWL